MPVPQDITAVHISEAMRRVQRDGIPADAHSTKFDVLDPTSGARLPPKLVLSLAAEIATGRTFSRSDFSGGEATNKRLQQLGFDVVLKNGAQQPVVALADVKPGMVLTNGELTGAFAVGNGNDGFQAATAYACSEPGIARDGPRRSAKGGATGMIPRENCESLLLMLWRALSPARKGH